MGYSLPSGVVNTDSVYYYADTTLKFGPLVKQPQDQTLVLLDYSFIIPPMTMANYSFTVDVSSNPALVVSYPNLNLTGEVLSFLLSGGLAGQQYNISIIVTNTGGDTQTDVLTINIPSSGDCACDTINPVPAIYSQLPLGESTRGYVNSAVRYFWGVASPSSPNILDQWYNPSTDMLYEWATDGTDFYWQLLASGNQVTEAPNTNTIYGRYNGYWVPEPIQTDAPQDGQVYSRSNSGWILNTLQTDAPRDGQIYGRKIGVWVAVPAAVINSDAPSDGKFYGRLNAGWSSLPPYPITIDAPQDGNSYTRVNGAWASGGTFQQSLLTFGNLGASGTLSINGNAQIGGVTTFGAQVALAYDPIQPLQAATKQYVDNQIVNAFNVNGSPFLRLAGGVMAGPIALSADPAAPMQPVTLQYFNAHSAAGLTDAPADGVTYGRVNRTWTAVLSLSGGVLSGPLRLASDPALPLGAATKQYVDTQITAVIPQPSGSPPPMDGTAATGASSAYARADHVHPTDTSLYPTSNPSGYQTAAQLTAALASYYPTSNPSGYQTAAQVTAALSPYALTTAVPVSSNGMPTMNGVGSPGAGTTWSRGDHTHPTDTSRIGDAPSDGQQYTRRNAAWSVVASVTVGVTPPSSPIVGSLYYDTNACQLYVWYNDGNSSQWVAATNSGVGGTGGGGGYLPLTGGVVTGPVDLKVQTVVQAGASLSINRTNGENCALSLTATITSVAVTNWPASGVTGKVRLVAVNTGAFAISGWPTGTIWPGGVAPTITSGAGKKDIILLMSDDGGVTIYGSVVGQDYH